MNSILEKITKMPSLRQEQILKGFIRLDLDDKLSVMENQRKIFHTMKMNHDDTGNNSLLTLASLILAISAQLEGMSDTSVNAHKMRANMRRNTSKRERLLGYLPLVVELKEREKMSFREIAEYLKKYHRFEVAYSTIYAIYKEIKGTSHE